MTTTLPGRVEAIIIMLKITRTAATIPSGNLETAVSIDRKPPKVSKTRFIARDQRSAMYDLWLNGSVGIWQLMKRNGLTLNEVEDALREEFAERRLRAERIERQRAVLLQMPPRHSGDTGPLAGPSAVRPTHFGGMLLNAIGIKRAA